MVSARRLIDCHQGRPGSHAARRMSSTGYVVLLGTLAVGLLGARAASAQILGPMEFTTSFPFQAGRASLPPGHYTLRPDEANPNIIELMGPHRSVFFTVVNTVNKTSPPMTEVVFDRVGGRYELDSVWIKGLHDGIESADAERDLSRVRHEGTVAQQHVMATSPEASR